MTTIRDLTGDPSETKASQSGLTGDPLSFREEAAPSPPASALDQVQAGFWTHLVCRLHLYVLSLVEADIP